MRYLWYTRCVLAILTNTTKRIRERSRNRFHHINTRYLFFSKHRNHIATSATRYVPSTHCVQLPNMQQQQCCGHFVLPAALLLTMCTPTKPTPPPTSDRRGRVRHGVRADTWMKMKLCLLVHMWRTAGFRSSAGESIYRFSDETLTPKRERNELAACCEVVGLDPDVATNKFKAR